MHVKHAHSVGNRQVETKCSALHQKVLFRERMNTRNADNQTACGMPSAHGRDGWTTEWWLPHCEISVRWPSSKTGISHLSPLWVRCSKEAKEKHRGLMSFSNSRATHFRVESPLISKSSLEALNFFMNKRWALPNTCSNSC